MTVAADPQAATVGALLEQARRDLAAAGVDQPRRTAETLIGFVLGHDRSDLFAHPERQLSDEDVVRFRTFVGRRAAGEPIQHITGVREFYGREFEVTPDVLIPRPETELLIEAVLERAQDSATIIDVGAGSGCIAVTLAAERHDFRIAAVDISPAALAVAEDNANRHGATVEFKRGDLLDGIEDESYDVVVSNPPYVALQARDDLAPEVLREPEIALFAGEDGLDVYKRLIPQAARVLKPGGLLALELGFDSLSGVRTLVADWRDIEVRPDLAGIPRVLLARRP